MFRPTSGKIPDGDERLMLPSITIVIPAYNHEGHVVQTLDSCLDSGLPDVEIVICDDASGDATAERIEAWVRDHGSHLRRVKFIRHTKNTGLCAAMNELVAEASGEFIHYIDSDDYFLPGGLLTKTLAVAERPDWLAGFCDGQAVGPEGELFSPSLIALGSFIPSRLTTEGMGEELLYHWGPPVHQMTWRRTAFKAHGGAFEYDPRVFCPDYDSALWAAGQRALGYIPAVCQAYRYRSFTQTSGREPIMSARDNAYVLGKNAQYFPPHLQAGFRTLALMHYNRAIGDTTQSGYLEEMHKAGHEAYLRRVAENGDTPSCAPACETDDYGLLLASLQKRIGELEDKLASRRTELQRVKAAARETTARQRDLLEDYRHRLRHHGASPLRALALWWRSKKD
ncbi:MAG: glycosyltransferase family 2 protein [Verrucomicrobiales bacterium]